MVPRMVQGCEVRLCDPCARVRPCVPCVSRLPRCLFTVLYPTYLASEIYPKTSCVFGVRCATADFAARVGSDQRRKASTRPNRACACVLHAHQPPYWIGGCRRRSRGAGCIVQHHHR